MEMMIVLMEVMNHQNIVIPREELALEISLLATTDIAYPEFISAMVIMIVLIIRMKTNAISVVSTFYPYLQYV
jgi:hypothetical protein